MSTGWTPTSRQARGSNARFTAEVGLPACRAVVAFVEDRHDDVVSELLPIRHTLATFGGSHAQRDASACTVLESALRAGRFELAKALTAERLGVRETSLYGWLQRARALDGLGDAAGAATAVPPPTATAPASPPPPDRRPARRNSPARLCRRPAQRPSLALVIDHLRTAWDELTAPGAGFAMSEIEVRGIPTRVFDQRPAEHAGALGAGQAHGDNDYIVYEDERYTYAEIDAQVRALAQLLPRPTAWARATGWRWPCATTRNGSSATGRRSASAPPSSA